MNKTTGESAKSIVRWTLGADELDVAERLVGILGSWGCEGRVYDYPDRNVVAVKVSARPLAELFVKLCGFGSRDKALSPEVMLAPIEWQAAFLDAYCSGDGASKGAGRCIYTSSPMLARQVSLIVQRVYGVDASVHVNVNSPGPDARARGEAVGGNIYHIDYGMSYVQRRYGVDGFHTAHRVASSSRYHKTGKVYNLEVEGDHTYCVEGLLVHNCSHAYALLLAANMRARGDFMRDRQASFDGYFGPDNFYMGTIATWTPCSMPDSAPDYESASGSRYWYVPDGVIRESGHWGSEVGSCDWYLDGYGWGSSFSDDSGIRYGFCRWADFELGDWSVTCYGDEFARAIEDAGYDVISSGRDGRGAKWVDVRIEPDMLRGGRVYVLDRSCGFRADYFMMIDDDMAVSHAAFNDAAGDELITTFGSRGWKGGSFAMKKFSGGGMFPQFEWFEEDRYGRDIYEYEFEDYYIRIGRDLHGIVGDGKWDWEVCRANVHSDVLLISWGKFDSPEDAYDDLRDEVFHIKPNSRSQLWFDDLAGMDILFSRSAYTNMWGTESVTASDVYSVLLDNVKMFAGLADEDDRPKFDDDEQWAFPYMDMDYSAKADYDSDFGFEFFMAVHIEEGVGHFEWSEFNVRSPLGDVRGDVDNVAESVVNGMKGGFEFWTKVDESYGMATCEPIDWVREKFDFIERAAEIIAEHKNYQSVMAASRGAASYYNYPLINQAVERILDIRSNQFKTWGSLSDIQEDEDVANLFNQFRDMTPDDYDEACRRAWEDIVLADRKGASKVAIVYTEMPDGWVRDEDMASFGIAATKKYPSGFEAFIYDDCEYDIFSPDGELVWQKDGCGSVEEAAYDCDSCVWDIENGSPDYWVASLGSPKVTSHDWDDFVSQVEQVTGFSVDSVSRERPCKWMVLWDPDGVEYEAEVERYSDGGYELMLYNVNKCGKVMSGKRVHAGSGHAVAGAGKVARGPLPLDRIIEKIPRFMEWFTIDGSYYLQLDDVIIELSNFPGTDEWYLDANDLDGYWAGNALFGGAPPTFSSPQDAIDWANSNINWVGDDRLPRLASKTVAQNVSDDDEFALGDTFEYWPGGPVVEITEIDGNSLFIEQIDGRPFSDFPCWVESWELRADLEGSGLYYEGSKTAYDYESFDERSIWSYGGDEFTYLDMLEFYDTDIDHSEYPTFEDWEWDMVRSGVFTRVAFHDCDGNEVSVGDMLVSDEFNKFSPVEVLSLDGNMGRVRYPDGHEGDMNQTGVNCNGWRLASRKQAEIYHLVDLYDDSRYLLGRVYLGDDGMWYWEIREEDGVLAADSGPYDFKSVAISDMYDCGEVKYRDASAGKTDRGIGDHSGRAAFNKAAYNVGDVYRDEFNDALHQIVEVEEEYDDDDYPYYTIKMIDENGDYWYASDTDLDSFDLVGSGWTGASRRVSYTEYGQPREKDFDSEVILPAIIDIWNLFERYGVSDDSWEQVGELVYMDEDAWKGMLSKMSNPEWAEKFIGYAPMSGGSPRGLISSREANGRPSKSREEHLGAVEWEAYEVVDGFPVSDVPGYMFRHGYDGWYLIRHDDGWGDRSFGPYSSLDNLLNVHDLHGGDVRVASVRAAEYLERFDVGDDGDYYLNDYDEGAEFHIGPNRDGTWYIEWDYFDGSDDGNIKDGQDSAESAAMFWWDTFGRYAKSAGRRLEYEDDIVIIRDPDGVENFKGSWDEAAQIGYEDDDFPENSYDGERYHSVAHPGWTMEVVAGVYPHEPDVYVKVAERNGGWVWVAFVDGNKVGSGFTPVSEAEAYRFGSDCANEHKYDFMIDMSVCPYCGSESWNGEMCPDCGKGRSFKMSSIKNATRHFTYAEMKELEDEIDGRELHNADRFKDGGAAYYGGM